MSFILLSYQYYFLVILTKTVKIVPKMQKSIRLTALLGCKNWVIHPIIPIDWRDKNAALIYTRATKNVKNGDFIKIINNV